MQHATQTALAMAIVMLGALGALGACSGKNGSSGTGSGTGTSAPGLCDDLTEVVRALYAATPEAGDLSPEVRAELLEANVHMVISDCETAPASFKPCIHAAKTVAELEASCTVPLDDEGTVEGGQFR